MSALLHIIFLIPLVLTAKLCEDKDTTVCGGCPRRPTFEQTWLEQEHPDLAEYWKNSTFSAPTMEYKDCTSVNATCPSGTRVAVYSFLSLNITVNKQVYPNPLVLKGIECRTGGFWYDKGMSQNVNAQVIGISVSCIKP
ncbi:hypothetical protein CAEBREN_13856 [Caenorhabditis brenneri]|uniref:Uncharacterized protein n=1 Tax=Caenorhabditis brenneri TaxID=135651 RepID=G0NCN4_CAEBE|nr:hypothetical protein CAEBREN_13856 [Caenorhabditis brenneri]